MISPYTGMGHREHPLLNTVVRDTKHGVTGRLMAVCPEATAAANGPFNPMPAEGPAVAWLRRPEGGGREWTTPLDAITPAGNSTPPRTG